MGKKVKKKARNALKEKRACTSSPRAVPQENNNDSSAVVDEGVVAEKVVEKVRKVCVHLEKGVNVAEVTSKIESAESTGCEGCREGVIDRKGGKGKGKHGKKKGSSDSRAESKATWVCLQCGHFSCGGVGLPTGPQTHAVRHSRQSRHPLVIQLENPHLRWCFSCSMLIPVDKSEDHGDEKDVLSDIAMLIKKQSPKVTSVDVEDIWFGSGSVLSDIKSENKVVNVSNGKDFYAVRGLVNLGNTCFFNSVMQNLLAMDILREYLLSFDGFMGPLTSALKKVYVETSPGSGLRNVINPRPLFGCVCAKAPQFRGYQQQDSHELLRCLLDGLSTEDLCSKKSENTSRENGESVPLSPTIIDAIFGGQISSTVCCVECGHSSVVYEPCLDLSLSIPTKKSPPKKAQPAPRTRKGKLPPKRVGKTRSKVHKDVTSGPAVSGCNPAGSSEFSSGLNGVSVGCSVSPGLVEPCNGVDGSHLVSQDCITTQQESASTQVSQSAEQEVDSLSWLDFLEPVTQGGGGQEADTRLDHLEAVSLLDDQNLTVENGDLSVSQEFGSKDANHDTVTVQNTAESTGEVSVHTGEINVMPQSAVDDGENEQPVQVQDNEILLLTYKEDGATAVEGIKIDADISSSAVGNEEDTLGFVGLGDLFDEPEAAGPSSAVSNNMQANDHFGNGFLGGNSTDTDADEIDDTDSPVSVDSCLAHFVKSELLSGEHAWHCENCSKIFKEERQKLRKNQVNSAPVLQRSISLDGCSSSEVALDCSSTVLANNISSDPDEYLKKLETLQINGLFPALPQEEENRESENACSSAICSRQHDEASLGGKSVNSCNVSADHVPVGRLSGSEEHESGEDEEEDDVDSKSIKVMRDATKRILISKSPSVLTIHLKRFGQDARGRLSKLSGHVVFKEFIDLRPYMDKRFTGRDDCFYQLVGVVEHSGSMRGGHYVAYVRGGDRRRGSSEEENHIQRHSVWYYASDAYVRETTLKEVLRSEAYILFYEKVKP